MSKPTVSQSCSAVKKEGLKRLRIDEILEPQSAVKPLSNRIPAKKHPKKMSKFTISKIEKIKRNLQKSGKIPEKEDEEKVQSVKSIWDVTESEESTPKNEYLEVVKPKKVKVLEQNFG
jgi:hypothetical protein